jgi:glyoxylase-like metal-dependent hydrolase (beta-lactamase superfamily II)
VTALEVTRLVLGELDTNCWIVSDGAGGPLVVIDPAAEPERVLAAVDGRPVAAIVLTHGHFDHIGAVSELVRATGAPLMAHTADAAAVTSADGNGGAEFGFDVTAPAPDRLLEDGDVIEAGRLSLTVWATPGHTPGSIGLLAGSPEGPEHLFSGDTLFAGSVGRTDLSGGDARAMRGSIALLASLPSSTVVHPGHGPDTTIGHESRHNYFWPRG